MRDDQDIQDEIDRLARNRDMLVKEIVRAYLARQPERSIGSIMSEAISVSSVAHTAIDARIDRLEKESEK